MSESIPSSPIRVCFIAPKAYPLFNPAVKGVLGGAEVDLYFLATELAKDNRFAVSFLTADYGQQKTVTIEGVKIIRTLDFAGNPLANVLKIWRGLSEADARIYMIKTVSSGTFLVAFFCRLKARKFLYRSSDSPSCDGTYLRLHPVLGKIYLWALRTAANVFVQNKMDELNLLRTTGVQSTVIPNGHRLINLRQHERDTILWVGRSAEIKEPKLFIDLAEKIPDQKFTMVCQQATGDNKYNQLLARAGEVRNLEFIQHVSFDRVYTYFQRAKVFVNTSRAEGFPNTFIQACQAGTPILSLDVNPDGFLDKYNCGICCNGSTERFVEALKFLLAENRFLEIGRNAGKYVEQNHDIKKIVEQYKAVLCKML